MLGGHAGWEEPARLWHFPAIVRAHPRDPVGAARYGPGELVEQPLVARQPVVLGDCPDRAAVRVPFPPLAVEEPVRPLAARVAAQHVVGLGVEAPPVERRHLVGSVAEPEPVVGVRASSDGARVMEDEEERTVRVDRLLQPGVRQLDPQPPVQPLPPVGRDL